MKNIKQGLFDAFGTCLMAFVLGSCAFVLTGCPSLGKVQQPIDAGNVAPLWTIVLERYDTYVAADTSVTDLERSSLELDSALLKGILEKAMGSND